MAATLTVINLQGQTLATYRLAQEQNLAIRAQNQVQYHLAGEGGMAPTNVEAARAGNDLLMRIDGEAVLKIEGYFLLDDTGLKNPLFGMNESGQYVAYGIVEAPTVLPAEHILAEEVAGVAASEGASVSALTAFGIGTLALGGLALAAQSGSESSATNPDKRQPQTPLDPNQPAPPPVDNGNITPPPSGGGNTTHPPSGGGNNHPPPQPPKPNGSVTIEGEVKVGQTLTAKITDSEGVSGSPQYQWLADGQPISGATQSTYTLTANEKGKAISVQATYTDGQNTAENPSSVATAQVIEDTPAAPPSVTDTTVPTLTVSATPSTLTPGSSAQLIFKVSEPVKGFTADDVVVQGGTLSAFRQVDTTTFTATFTAGAAGKASVTVADDAFVDLADNPNKLANLELVIGAAPNQAPTDITLSANRLPENQAGAVIGKLATVDPDQGDKHTYAVNDNRFEVDAQGNLKLKDGVKVEFAAGQTIPLTITTTDKGGKSHQETFTINVQDDPNYPVPPAPQNQAPTDIDLDNLKVSEGQDGAVVGKLSTTDPDQGDSHTYTVSDTRFEVVNGELKLKSGEVLNFDQEQTVNLTVTTTDQGGKSYQESFTLNVQDDPNYPVPPAPQNQAPTDIDLDNLTVVEGQGGAVVGKLTTTDPDQGDSHTYTVSDTRFEVVNGQLKLKSGEVLNFDQEQTVNLTVTTTDQGGESYQESFSLNVQDDPNYPAPQNQAPTDIDLDNLTVAEGQDGAVVGKLSTTDPDQGDSHTYTVSDTRFEVVNGELKLKSGEVLNFDQEQTVNLTVTTTDQGGKSYQESFSLNVQDDPNYPAPPAPANQAPTDINLDNLTVVEGKDGAVVGKLTTTDPDQGDSHTYTVSDTRFEVVNGQLKLKAGEKLDYATEQNIILTITTTDKQGATYQESFSLNVQDDPNYPAPPAPQNQAPTDINLDKLSIAEGQDGAVVGKLSTTDPDQGDRHTYTVSDARFEVVNSELKLKAGEVLNFDQEKTIDLTVTTTDKGGKSYQESFSLNVQDDPNYPAPPAPQNQAPTDIDLDNLTVVEGQGGAVVGKLTTTDPDQGDSHTYSVSDARFEVVGGELKLKAGEKLDYATEQNIILTITTTDKQGAIYQESFSLNVQDDPNYPVPPAPQNQAPTDITLDKLSIAEGQDGAVVGKLSTTDPDQGDSHTYTVSDTRFEVVNSELKLKAGEVLNFDQEKTIDLTVTTTDQGGKSYQESFSLNVQDDPNYPAPPVNNPPTGEVMIHGEAQVGKTLSATHTLQDADGLGTITYRWYADGTEIASGDSYTLQSTDKGKQITVKAEYTDGKGHAESVASQATGAVVDPPSAEVQFIKGSGKDVGGVSIVPPIDADRMEVSYTNEDNRSRSLEVLKDGGLWRFRFIQSNPDVKLDAQSGVITIGPDEIKDGSIIYAKPYINGVGGNFVISPQMDDDYLPPDPPLVSLVGPSLLNEGENGIYTVMLDKAASQDITVSVKLDLFLSGGGVANATLGRDNVVIPAGKTRATFDVSTIDDQIFYEGLGRDKFQIRLVNPKGGAKLDRFDSVTTQIIDNDPALPIVSLGTENPAIKEGGEALYTVNLDKVATQDVKVNVKIISASTNDDDLALSTTEVIIPTGQKSATFTLSAKQDGLKEGLEEFSVVLENPTGARIEKNMHLRQLNQSVQGSVSDENSKPVVSIVGAHDTRITEGESISYTLKLDKPAVEEVIVEVSVFNKEEFYVATQEVRIAPGQESANFTLQSRNDPKAESINTTSISINAAQGADFVSHHSHEITIIDNDKLSKPIIRQGPDQGSVSITSGVDLSDKTGTLFVEMEVNFTDESGQKHTVAIRPHHNLDSSEWFLKGPLTKGLSVDEITGTLTIDANMLQDGSEVTAVNYMDRYGAPESEIARMNAGVDKLPRILSSQLSQWFVGTDDADVLVSSDIDPVAYAKLMTLDSEDILGYLHNHADQLHLSLPGKQYVLEAGNGDDVLIATSRQEMMRGGDGKDSFVFVANGAESTVIDQILDFHAGEDIIHLISGRAGNIQDVRFDENTQSLHYQSQQSGNSHDYRIDIHTHNGQTLSEAEILQFINII